MYVDHHFDPILLLHDPLAITRQHIVVVFVHGEVRVLLLARRFEFPFDARRNGVKRRRRQQDQLRLGGVYLFYQPVHAVLERVEPLFAERVVDAVVEDAQTTDRHASAKRLRPI